MHLRIREIESPLVHWQVHPGKIVNMLVVICVLKTVLIVVYPADQYNRKEIDPDSTQFLHIAAIIPNKSQDVIDRHIITLREAPRSIS